MTEALPRIEQASAAFFAKMGCGGAEGGRMATGRVKDRALAGSWERVCLSRGARVLDGEIAGAGQRTALSALAAPGLASIRSRDRMATDKVSARSPAPWEAFGIPVQVRALVIIVCPWCKVCFEPVG